MSRWSLEFLPSAEADFNRIDRATQNRIIEKLEWLVKNFDDILPISLNGEFKDFYKLRVGDLRVLYSVNWKDNIISVCYIDRRDKVYKKR